MSKLVIHVGMGKAASTTIQRGVLSCLSSPVSIGRHDWSITEEMELPRFWWRGLSSDNKDISSKAINALNEILKAHSLVVLSDEVFSSSYELLVNLIRNCKKIDCPVHVVLVTRKQEDYLSSLFNHGMRSRVVGLGVPRLHSHLISRISYRGDIDLWVSDLLEANRLGESNILKVLDYDSISKMVLKALGPDSISVIPVELIKYDAGNFAERLSRILRMNVSEVETALGLRFNVTGDRLNDYFGGEYVHKLLKSKYLKPFKSLGFRRDNVRSLFLILFKALGLKNYEYMSDQSLENLSVLFCASNKELDVKLDFELRDLGYKV